MVYLPIQVEQPALELQFGVPKGCRCNTTAIKAALGASLLLGSIQGAGYSI